MRPREGRGQAQGHPRLVRLSPPRKGAVPCLSAPIMRMGGCGPISPALTAWGAPASPCCPGPGCSGVSLVPTPSPCSAPFSLEPEPPRGCPGWPAPYLTWGQPGCPAPGTALLSLGPCPPWEGVRGAGGGQPLLVSRCVQQHSSAPRGSLRPGLLAGLFSPPRQLRPWLSTWALQEGTLALGCAGSPLRATLLLRCLLRLSCSGDAVREEGRWEGCDVAKPPSAPPGPPPLPSFPS